MLMWVDPLTIFSRILTKLNSIWIAAVYPLAHKGRKLSVHYTCDIRNPQLIEVANGVDIHKDVWLHAWPSAPDSRDTTLRIGSRVLIGRRAHISAKNLITIGDDAIISASVLIQDHGHAYDDVTLPIRLQGISAGGRVRIGKGCWLGQGAAIVCTEGELVIGENCVVSANALVTKSAPPFSVLVGNPAKIVKQYDPAKDAWVLGSASRPSEQPVRIVG
jgi:lipopolysaccharide O-acetyltransferase